MTKRPYVINIANRFLKKKILESGAKNVLSKRRPAGILCGCGQYSAQRELKMPTRRAQWDKRAPARTKNDIIYFIATGENVTLILRRAKLNVRSP